VFTPYAIVAPTEYYRLVHNAPVIGSPTLDLLFVDGSHVWFGLPADNAGRFVAQHAMEIVEAHDPFPDVATTADPDARPADAAQNKTGLVFTDTMSPNTLVDLEGIKRTKYRYLRCLDQKLWEELGTTLTADCVASYGGGAHAFEGRDAIVEFLQSAMGSESMLSSHRVHHPELEMVGPATAEGTWAMDDVVVMTDQNVMVRGAGFYTDEYRRMDGIWRISKTGYKRTFEELVPRGDARLTASWWETGGRSQLGS
jgi:hypothetical protein